MSPPLYGRKTLVFCGLAAFLSYPAMAQTLTSQGVEASVGAPMTGDQVYPAASINASGGYVVFQGAKMDGKGQGIGAIRLDSTLAASGAPFVVNQRATGSQQHPSVALLAGGGALVTWQSGVKGDSDVFARFLRPDGTFLTGDIQVNPSVTTLKSNRTVVMTGYKNNKLRTLKFRLGDSARVLRDRNSGAVAVPLPDGGAVVAYSGWRRVHTNWMEVVELVKTSRGRSYTNDVPQKFGAHQDWMQDVFFQRFDAAGHKVGGEVLVNQFTRYNQRNPSAVVLPDGRFAVVWVSENFVPLSFEVAHPRVDIMGRLFSASGQPLGSEFTVNSDVRGSGTPAVSAMSDGRFTVVWAGRDGVRTNGWDIYGRAFAPDGSAAGSVFRVNALTYGDQFSPRISSAGTNQLVVWSSLGQDKNGERVLTQVTREAGLVTIPTGQSGSWQSVYGRLLSDGAPVGNDVRINTTLGKQLHPGVAGDGSSRFLATWAGFNVETGFDLYNQSYGMTPSDPAQAGLQLVNSPNPSNTQAASPRMTLTGPMEKLRLNWSAESGARYQVQVSPDLTNWTNVGAARSATGEGDSIAIDIGSGNAFYRVQKLP